MNPLPRIYRGGRESVTVIVADPGDSDNTPAARLKNLADEYSAQINSIIEINRAVIPEMAAREVDEVAEIRENILGKLSPDDRITSTDYLHEITANLLEVTKSANRENKARLSVEVSDRDVGTAVSHLVLQLAMRAKAGSRDALLRKSLLVSAISTFEVLFGQVARTVYSVNTSSLNDSEYSFTLQELANFNSLDDAREYLIEKRISALLRESIDGWEKWLKRACAGVSMESFPVHWPLVRESFARRNLVVHTGGVVNHLYVSVIEKLRLPDEVKVTPGSRADVGESYLDCVLQELLALGNILVCTVGIKLYKKEAKLFTSAALNAARDSSFKGTHHSSRALCQHAKTLKLSRQEEMQTMVRHWLSMKETAGLESIRSDVEEWDTSGLDISISHYKSVLLDDIERATQEVSGLISKGRLSKIELAIDPIYSKLLQCYTSSQSDREAKGNNIDDSGNP